MTFTAFLIRDLSLVENVPHYYSRSTNSYVPEIEKAHIFSTHQLALDETISVDDEIVPVEVNIALGDPYPKGERLLDETEESE